MRLWTSFGLATWDLLGFGETGNFMTASGIRNSDRWHGRPSRRNRAGAFSLVELLVVIAIISVLTAILLPVIKMVREMAQGTRCASNLRQVALASDAYTSEWNGLSLPGYTSTNILWYQQIAADLEESSVVNVPTVGRVLRGCPSWRSTEFFRSQAVGSWQWQMITGYSMTLYLLPAWQITAGGAPPYPFGCTMYNPTFAASNIDNTYAQITKRDSRPFVFDSANTYVDMASFWPAAINKAALQRHQGKGNVLFWDYHVGRQTWSEVCLGQGLAK